MRLVGDWWYYAFWATLGGCGLLLLWQINAKLGELLRCLR